MVAFYNQADQDIYNSGRKFIPQERYRLDYTPPVTAPPVASGGITNTNAFTNSGNDFNVYNPDPNSIVNRNYNPYLSRNAAENSFLPGRSNATDQVFNPKQLGGAQMPDELGVSTNTVPLGNNRISSSQLGINLPGGQVQNAYTRARNAMGARGDDTMSRDYPEFTAKEVARLANNNIQDYRQNYGANTQYEKDNYYDTVDSPFARSQTQINKFKDNYPGYFAPKPLEGIPGAIQKYAQNSLLGRAIKSLKYTLPTNRRGILENELSGKGVMINDMGQIVASPGNINTAENIMAGYNANKVDASTFQKRRDMINDKMKDPAQKEAKLAALNAAEKNFLDAQSKTDLVFEDIEAEKKKRKKKGNIIKRFLTKKKETKAAKEKAAAAAPTGGSYTASGGVTDSNYNQAANIAGGGGGDSATNAQGQTAREATYDGNKNTGTSQGYSQHYARGGRAGYFFGGRAGYAEGGPIYSRLGTLSSGVQSAEQQLQGINASLQKAESDLGSDSPGGGSSLAGGPSFTSNFEDANNQGPGSNLLYGGGSGGTNTPGLVGDNTLNNTTAPFGSLYGGDKPIKSPMPVPGNPELAGSVSSIGGQDPARQAYEKAMQDAKKQRADGMMGRVVLPGEMSFEDFSGMYNSKLSGLQPLPSTGGGLGGFFPGKGGMEAFDGGLLNNQLPTGQPQPISEERMNSLNRSIIGNGFYDLNKGLGGLL